MFGKFGPMELVLILGIALLVFGPAKLPEIGKSIGKAVGEFKNHANNATKDLGESTDNQSEGDK